LPVDVQSRDTPQGVPLHEILRAVREQAPSASSMTVRDGRLLLRTTGRHRPKKTRPSSTFWLTVNGWAHGTPRRQWLDRLSSWLTF
jgi:hypothetical protein